MAKKTCPYCGSREYASLRAGKYPRCCYKRLTSVTDGLGSAEKKAALEKIKKSIRVSVIGGEWVKRGPLDRVISVYRARMQRSNQWGQYFILDPGSKEWARTMPNAKILLDRCGWDVELACRIIDIAFQEFKNPCGGFHWVIANRNWPVRFAKAKKALKIEKERDELQKGSIAIGAEDYALADNLYAAAGMDFL